MTLRIKTLLIIGITLAGLLSGLYATFSRILLNSILELEAQDTRQNVERVRDAQDAEIADIDSKAGD